jgi:hypothetical protein
MSKTFTLILLILSSAIAFPTIDAIMDSSTWDDPNSALLVVPVNEVSDEEEEDA